MQRSVAPNGLSHAVPPIAGRHRASGAESGDASGYLKRRIFRIALPLLAGLAVVGHVGWLAFTHTSAAPRPYPAGTRTQQHSGTAVDDWIRANLPAGIHLLADGFDPPAGYRSVALATAGANWKNYSYFVTSRTSDPSTGSTLATVWKSSTAVAIFDDVQVRYVLPLTPPDEIQRNHDLDRVERLRAGEALQHNAHLTSSPAAKHILATGQLDLRAAAVITALVNQAPVALNKITVVAPEAAAEMPARAVTIYSSDPAGVTRALSGVSPALAPDQVTVGENGALDLHWPLSVTPMPSVN
jgi:hypothetical protein